MSPTFYVVTRNLQGLFGGTANLFARKAGFTQRRSKMTGSVFAQTLIFGWLHNPQATLEELAQVAGSLGVPISAQGLDQRFGPAAATFLKRLLQDAVLRVVASEPAAVSLLQRFAGVFVVDSTLLSLPRALAYLWPGAGGGGPEPERHRGRRDRNGGAAAIKAQVQLNLLDGSLSGPFLSVATVADQKGALQQASLPAGALRLADLGFFSLEKLQQLHEEKVWFVSRVQVGTQFFDGAGQVLTAAALLARHDAATVDVPIELGVDQRVPCRLLAWRVPAALAAQRRRKWRQESRWRGQRLHPEREVLADWTYYVTNVPKEMLSPEEAWILYRCRWQIELLFKLWKHCGLVDQSRSEEPWRVLCEVYAKLLGMIVQHWLLLASCWSRPERSLVKASATVRLHALSLALILEHGQLVLGLLQLLKECMSHGCRINRQRRHPPTHQILLELTRAG
jgi:hypothetical protein